MNAKEQILEKIRGNKPTTGSLPPIPTFAKAVDSLTDIFIVQANLAGSQTRMIHKIEEGYDFIQVHFPQATKIASCHDEIQGNFDLTKFASPKDLNPIDLAIIPSQLAVSENGAVWIDESQSRLRILPFITQHLIVVISARNIVENMHIAYQQLNIAKTGFGVWIGGPSKTADIEQTLVVGAQGARSLSIFIVS